MHLSSSVLALLGPSTVHNLITQTPCVKEDENLWTIPHSLTSIIIHSHHYSIIELNFVGELTLCWSKCHHRLVTIRDCWLPIDAWLREDKKSCFALLPHACHFALSSNFKNSPRPRNQNPAPAPSCSSSILPKIKPTLFLHCTAPSWLPQTKTVILATLEENHHKSVLVA